MADYWDDHMTGSDWLWMSLAMSVWLVLLVAGVYVAVRLASNNRR